MVSLRFQKKHNNRVDKRLAGFRAIAVIILLLFSPINLIADANGTKSADANYRDTVALGKRSGGNSALTAGSYLEFIDSVNKVDSGVDENKNSDETSSILSRRTTIGELYEHIPAKKEVPDITEKPKSTFPYRNYFIISAVICTLLFFFVVLLMVLIVKKRKGGSESEEDIYEI